MENSEKQQTFLCGLTVDPTNNEEKFMNLVFFSDILPAHFFRDVDIRIFTLDTFAKKNQKKCHINIK